MFDRLFGWRKASKCKSLIGSVQCRLKLLKNKRSCIARQLREDLGELIRNGHHQLVFDRVEKLFMDENLVTIYDLLEYYCGFIIINLPYIRRHKDLPNDINEAISTLIYSSSRLGDLPELMSIRNLFEERYGKRFAKVALDLLPGNLVNRQIKENLSVKCVSDDAKYRLVDEITRSCFRQGHLLLEWPKKEDKAIDVETRGNKEIECSNIAEFESNDGGLQDQRLFLFDSSFDSIAPQAVKARPRKRRKRSVSREIISSVTDIQTAIYYGKSPRNHNARTRHHRKILVEERHKTDKSIQEPCVFTFIVYRRVEKESRGRSSSKHSETMSENSNEFDGGEASGEESSDHQQQQQKQQKQQYERAITLPPERPKMSSAADNISRSISLPVQQPNHVHPKLPNYDELSAKFMALKREKIHNRFHQNAC